MKDNIMKKRILITSFILTYFLVFSISTYASDIDDRLIRLEEGQKKIEQLITLIRDDMKQMRSSIDNLWLGYICGLIGIIAIIIWDRRTAFQKEREKIDRIINALKEFAVKDENFGQILKYSGLF